MKVIAVLWLFFGVISGSEEVYSNASATCSYKSTCTAGGYTGICVSISAGCCSTGVSTSNLCSGSSDIKCCTELPCSVDGVSGTCMQSSLCASKGGVSHSGYCNGPSDLKCCVGDDSSNASYGVDVSDAIDETAANCFKSNGVSFVVPRGYKSTGAVDVNMCTSLTNAKNAGIKTRDVYMFPSPTSSKTALEQIDELARHLETNCASDWSGRIWLDIEGSQYWLESDSLNQDWYRLLVDSCFASGYRCGIYSSSLQWESIFGSVDFSYGSEDMPLWYAHYDGVDSFDDFPPFGGWTQPYAKQYAGDLTICDMGVDRNYAADVF